MSLSTPESIQKLQAALHAKAKGSPGYRFYALYDKLYRADVLAHAYASCKANRGAAGVDGQAFDDIESYGVQRWLDELAQALKEKTYRPEAVRRVYIPKPDGKQRPLGIPTVRDRVAQMAAVLVLEPIFEADLPPEQYAYRAGRSALDAVQAVWKLLQQGHHEVVDADLSGYFDSIPHAELLKSVARRIVDGAVLHLIKMWLTMPVEEYDERGRRRRTTVNKDTGRGTPQGAPISPLLSNLYMRRFLTGWRVLGYERRLKAHIVNYADDFVICCRGTGQKALAAMRDMMTRLKLTVNESKTRLCRLPDESFDFLGYTLGRCYSWRDGRTYLGTRPSAKRIARVCETIRAECSRRWRCRPETEQIDRMNSTLIGWSNYFCHGPVSQAYRAVDHHARRWLRQWLRAKYQTATAGRARCSDTYLHEGLGLVRLSRRTRNFPWANRV
jgi:group II intron reverse transcriptase/maturase